MSMTDPIADLLTRIRNAIAADHEFAEIPASKFKSREYNRCRRCGRPRGYFRKFGLCRICLREAAHEGYVPGMTKSSW